MDGGTAAARPHRFTVAEYHRMAETGILNEDSRVELIKGQIVDMAPIGAPHLGTVNRLTRLVITTLAGRAVISPQNPVRLDDRSEPEPDLAVLKPRADDYTAATPRPDEVLLLVEVSDSTFRYDRDVKVPLYAESGIPECWLVDIAGRGVEVYRQPQDGEYAQVWRIGVDGALDIEALPGVSFTASNVFGPA